MSDPGAGTDVRDYLRSLRGHELDGPLPPHHPGCLGCGPEAERGFHLQVVREGDEVVATHTFPTHQAGAPGIAHGGAVATVCDDVLGFCMYVAKVAGVTRHLEMEYLRPVLVGVPYEIRAHVEKVDGRKLWFAATGTAPDGTLTFTSRALFLQVQLSHFDQGKPGPVTP